MHRQSNTLNFILVKLILSFINWGKTLYLPNVNHESDDTQSTNYDQVSKLRHVDTNYIPSHNYNTIQYLPPSNV